MLSTPKLLLLVAALTGSTMSMAAPLTRAEVQARLASVEQAGFNPSATDLMYPQGIERAQARAAVQSQATATHPMANDGAYSVADSH